MESVEPSWHHLSTGPQSRGLNAESPSEPFWVSLCQILGIRPQMSPFGHENSSILMHIMILIMSGCLHFGHPISRDETWRNNPVLCVQAPAQHHQNPGKIVSNCKSPRSITRRVMYCKGSNGCQQEFQVTSSDQDFLRIE